jgi:adenosylhomocysteinase
VPQDIENEVAQMKLATMGISLDELTKEQKAYLSDWHEGT